jgi:tight adherence protein C
MYELLIPVLVFICVVAIGASVLAAGYASREPIRARLGTSTTSHVRTWGATRPEKKVGINMLDRVGRSVSGGRFSPHLAGELANAGYHNPKAPMIFIGLKVVLLLVASVSITAVMTPFDSISNMTRILIVIFAGGVFFFLPNLFVRRQREKRRREISQHLPDTLDLLEICVSAGMGLDMAWNAVAGEIRSVSPPLADEMVLTNLEMHLGASRSSAMRHMAQRTNAREISSLVGMLVQSDRFGTSVSEALKTFATTMREERSQRAQEEAEKAPVKLLFPLILFVFPAILVVVVGPAAITWTEIISGGQ